MCLFGLPTFVGLGAGRGFWVHSMIVGIFRSDVFAAVIALILGAASGFILSFGGRRWPDSRLGRAWVQTRASLERLRRQWLKPEEVARRRFARRLLIGWVLVPAIGMALAALGFGYYLGREADRRIAAAISEANRDDPSWRFDDLTGSRRRVPDERTRRHRARPGHRVAPAIEGLAG
ncbi:hypothetical protein [Singulisphaera sp. PoT]|uniref:hypothetical protein n=1 Tax=Singulisphaera sp. PoT TaxID=3411797 RepID=UPI003BF59447